MRWSISCGNRGLVSIDSLPISTLHLRDFLEITRREYSDANMLRTQAILQVQFLLKLASDFTQYVRSFPPSPKASFDLLRKLDHCFASLLCGQDIETKETLPGFENGLRMGMTTTDMVRCRSLVEQTRLLMVEIMSSGEPEDEDEDEEEEDDDEDDEDDGGGAGWGVDDDDDETYLDAARVYEHTIVQLEKRLGDSLGGSIGGWST